MYEKFEALIKDRGISAYKVARDTGLYTTLFYGWKKGRYKPKIDKLQIIAEYLGVSVTELL